MSDSNYVEVLCQCGWGSLKMAKDAVPENCPLCGCALGAESDDDFDDIYDDSMDGDAESALASAGFGTDEDYGDFGCDDDGF